MPKNRMFSTQHQLLVLAPITKPSVVLLGMVHAFNIVKFDMRVKSVRLLANHVTRNREADIIIILDLTLMRKLSVLAANISSISVTRLTYHARPLFRIHDTCTHADEHHDKVSSHPTVQGYGSISSRDSHGTGDPRRARCPSIGLCIIIVQCNMWFHWME